MATVTAVETKTPAVKSITLKLNVYEATDMVTFIETWFGKYGYGKVQNNEIHRALKAGLAGNTIN